MKINFKFLFSRLFCVASKGFMKVFQAFVKRFEATQKRRENNNLSYVSLFARDRDGRVNRAVSNSISNSKQMTDLDGSKSDDIYVSSLVNIRHLLP